MTLTMSDKYIELLKNKSDEQMIQKVLESRDNKINEKMNIYEALDFFIIDEPHHRQRFLGTFNYIKENLSVEKNLKVLDVGYPSNFGLLLLYYFPHIDLSFTDYDIRKYDENIERNKYDIILMFEVIEHLKDNQLPDKHHLGLDGNPININGICDLIEYNSIFHGTGIINALLNLRNQLKDEGILYISTPNVTSFSVIKNIFSKDYPYNWEPHPRELSKKKIVEYLDKTDLKILSYKFFESWNMTDKNFNQKIKDFLEELGYESNEREDNMIYAIIKKT